MPRRGSELVNLAVPARNKMKLVEEPASLDASYFDDEALPPGIVFNDILQNKWRIGKPIGRGSFGRIYLASGNIDSEVTKATARHVVKIEPHTNGPLFVEVHCMIRTAQATKVQLWRQRNKQKRLGMPVYIASGSFTDENTGVKYRFLVLPRYDIDLQKIIARTKVLDLKNVCVLAIQILDVLEYLHSEGYTHSDIKSSNLMLGFDGEKSRPAALKAPSYQKGTKEATVLAGKHRKAKSAKSRPSSYYDDEDFVANGSRDDSDEEESGNKLATVKNKLRNMLTDKDHRNFNRHHAFNLRHLSHYVNYEDLSSSVCSDQSYQKLIDFGNKNMIRTEGFYQDVNRSGMKTEIALQDEIHQQAVLSQSSGQIYLLDYGLACKFIDYEGKHKDFVMDARKAHDGTLEYSSRDSHIGAHSRRSDLETLGYNLIDWLSGTLPWKTMEVLAEPDLVHALKKKYMSDLKLFLKTCFKTEFYPQFLIKYFEYVTSLDFKDTPDYDYCRSLFKSELLKNGYDKDILLNFADPPKSPMSRAMFCSKRFGKRGTASDFIARNGIKQAHERENLRTLENDLKLELLKETLNTSSDGVRKPCTTRNFFVSDADLVARLKKSLMPLEMLGKKLSPKNLRSQKKHLKKRGVRKHRNSIGKFGNFMGSARQFTWAEILAGNPEDIIRKERNNGAEAEADDDDDTCKYKIRRNSHDSTCSDNNLQSPLLQKDFLFNMNPTYAMKEVVGAFKRKISGKSVKNSEDRIDGLEGYTPAMIKVYKMKERREQKERLEAGRQQYQKEFSSVPRSMRAKRYQTARKPDVTPKNMRNKTVSINSHESTDDEEITLKSREAKKPRTTRKTSETSDCDTNSVLSNEKTSNPKALVIKKRKKLSEKLNQAPKTVELESQKVEDSRVTRSNRCTSPKCLKALVKTTDRKQRTPARLRQSERVINNRRRLRSSKRNNK